AGARALGRARLPRGSIHAGHQRQHRIHQRAAGGSPMSTTVPIVTPVAGPVNLRRVLRSEWTKFRSLRSTWWSIAITVLMAVGVGVLATADAAGNPAASVVPTTVAGRSQLGGLISQLVVGVLAVLFISGEYGTGMIRSSMIAVPQRLTVLWAKMVVFV